MIHTNRVVTVGENESIIDRPIILYRGDREVEIEFELVGNEFMFSIDGNVIKTTNASHGQLVLNTPSGENMFSELAECHDGKVAFIVTKEMIDEFIEVGFYSFQIRLYDSAEQKSRVTLPPILNGFDIRNPIAAEDETNIVDQGLVGYARVYKDQSNEELPTFDWTGAYNKTEWVHHDVITENKLNKIEDALYSINANIKESDVVMLNTLDQVKKDADAYVKEHMAEVEQDVEDFERNINTGVEQFKIDTNAAMTAHKNEVSEVIDGFSGELENVNTQLAYNTNVNISVEMFGAKGGGVDDTKAIQSAIDYVASTGGGCVKFQAKTYKCNIKLPSNVRIEGQTRCHYDKSTSIPKGGTILKPYTAGLPVVSVTNDDTRLANSSIKNLMIDGEEFKNDGITDGLSILGCMYPQVEDVTIINCGRYGLNISNTSTRSSFYGFYKNILIRDCYVNNLRIVWDDQYSTYVTSQYFYGLFMINSNNKEGSIAYIQDVIVDINGGYCDSVGDYPVSMLAKTRMCGIKGNFSMDSAGANDIILKITSKINNPSINEILSGEITADGYYEINNIKSTSHLFGVSYNYPKFRNAGLRGYVYFSDINKDVYDTTNPFLYIDGGILSLFLTGSNSKAFQIRHDHSKPVWLKNDSTNKVAGLWVDDNGSIRSLAGVSTPSSVSAGGILTRLLDTIPSSATDSGKKGDLAQDENYFYICVENNIWKRIPISSW